MTDFRNRGGTLYLAPSLFSIASHWFGSALVLDCTAVCGVKVPEAAAEMRPAWPRFAAELDEFVRPAAVPGSWNAVTEEEDEPEPLTERPRASLPASMSETCAEESMPPAAESIAIAGSTLSRNGRMPYRRAAGSSGRKTRYLAGNHT